MLFSSLEPSKFADTLRDLSEIEQEGLPDLTKRVFTKNFSDSIKTRKLKTQLKPAKNETPLTRRDDKQFWEQRSPTSSKFVNSGHLIYSVVPTEPPATEWKPKKQEEPVVDDSAKPAADANKNALGMKNGMGKPNMFAKAPAGGEQSAIGGAKPAFGAKPAGGGGNSVFGAKPAGGANPTFGIKPAGGGANPVFGAKPAGGGANPTFGIKPTGGGEQAAIGGAKPTIGVAKPAIGGVKPTIGPEQTPVDGSKPTFGVAKPAIGGVKPTIGAEQTPVDGSKPTFGVAKPAIGVAKPTIGAEQTPVDGAKPTFGVAKLAIDGTKPAVGAEQTPVSGAKPAFGVGKPFEFKSGGNKFGTLKSSTDENKTGKRPPWTGGNTSQ